MAEYTGEVIYETPQGKTKPAVNPALVKALVPQSAVSGLSPQDQRAFDLAEAKRKADIALHVKENNYGIVEDAHQALMHTMAQYIRRKHLLVPVEKVVF